MATAIRWAIGAQGQSDGRVNAPDPIAQALLAQPLDALGVRALLPSAPM